MNSGDPGTLYPWSKINRSWLHELHNCFTGCDGGDSRKGDQEPKGRNHHTRQPGPFEQPWLTEKVFKESSIGGKNQPRMRTAAFLRLNPSSTLTIPEPASKGSLPVKEVLANLSKSSQSERVSDTQTLFTVYSRKNLISTDGHRSFLEKGGQPSSISGPGCFAQKRQHWILWDVPTFPVVYSRERDRLEHIIYGEMDQPRSTSAFGKLFAQRKH